MKWKLRWTETVVWESIVEADSKAEALDKLYDDDTQEHAEQVMSDDFDTDMNNIEVLEM